jgi:hypothetical protein
MKKATQRMLKQAIRIINSIDYPIQATKRIVTVSDGAKNVPAIELVAKPGENREFQAYLTADGRILFEKTRDHPGDGAKGIPVVHSFDDILWLGRIISVIQPLIEMHKENCTLS